MDAWVDRNVPAWLVQVITLSGIVVAATLAWAYADGSGFTGIELWGIIALGGLVGLLVVPLTVFAVKLAMLALVLGVLGAIGWVVYLLVTGT